METFTVYVHIESNNDKYNRKSNNSHIDREVRHRREHLTLLHIISQVFTMISSIWNSLQSKIPNEIMNLKVLTIP